MIGASFKIEDWIKKMNYIKVSTWLLFSWKQGLHIKSSIDAYPVLQSKFDPGESKIEEHDPIMNKILLKCSLWLQNHKILSNLVVLMLLFFFKVCKCFSHVLNDWGMFTSFLEF